MTGTHNIPRSLDAAKVAGSRFYSAERACKKCGSTMRYTSNPRTCVPCQRSKGRNDGGLSWERRALYRATFRAKQVGVPCTVTEAEIAALMVRLCPVLRIPLNYTSEKAQTWNSATLDRVNPKLGYVPGNIAVMSQRANRIKCDATAAELARVAAWVEMRERAARETACN